jgi:hypothetical protein
LSLWREEQAERSGADDDGEDKGQNSRFLLALEDFNEISGR